MYSLVLMSAMATTPNAPEFNGFFRDLFHRDNCGGCGGAPVRYNGYSGCAGSANAYACNGCCGGGGLFSGERIRSFFNMGGCCGGGQARAYGCSGVAYGCGGCCGGGCFGGPPVSYTPVFNGGLSCQGGIAMPAPAPIYDSFPTYTGNPGPAPSIPYADPTPAPPTIVPERSGLRPAGFSGPAAGPTGRATVVVRLPADAKLYADGTALKMAGGERTFTTPELPDGMEYTYRLTAEYERNGEVVSVTRRVVVRAGGAAAVEFTDLTATKPAPGGPDAAPARTGEAVAAAPVSHPKAAAPAPLPAVPPPATFAPKVAVAPEAAPAAGRATITVKLPAGASLYVDDRKSPAGGPVRQFATPPLPAGREFAYLIKAEVVRDGQPEQLIQKVAFRAGEQVVVDFSNIGGR